MLATLRLPDHYVAWNHRWHAPQGLDGRTYLPPSERINRRRARALGPFVWQPNSSTRAFEYPWAYFAADVYAGQRVLEIGGALSGLQFVLARNGADVVNVDPMRPYGRGETYEMDPSAFHSWLNDVHGTQVSLRTTTVNDAALDADSFDVVVCISTIEHLPPEEIQTILSEVARVLKPGGRFLVTVDLFLNLVPFTGRTANEWGGNISVRWIVDESGLRLESGEPRELYGFEEFDHQHILATLERYAIGTGYPQLAQVFALRKEGLT